MTLVTDIGPFNILSAQEKYSTKYTPLSQNEDSDFEDEDDILFIQDQAKLNGSSSRDVRETYDCVEMQTFRGRLRKAAQKSSSSRLCAFSSQRSRVRQMCLGVCLTLVLLIATLCVVLVSELSRVADPTLEPNQNTTNDTTIISINVSQSIGNDLLDLSNAPMFSPRIHNGTDIPVRPVPVSTLSNQEDTANVKS